MRRLKKLSDPTVNVLLLNLLFLIISELEYHFSQNRLINERFHGFRLTSLSTVRTDGAKKIKGQFISQEETMARKEYGCFSKDY